MRTTLTIEDQIVSDLKELAKRSGKPFTVVVNETLRAGLATKAKNRSTQPYRLRPASLGAVLPGFNLDKALAIADAVEDEEIARKVNVRK